MKILDINDMFCVWTPDMIIEYLVSASGQIFEVARFYRTRVTDGISKEDT